MIHSLSALRYQTDTGGLRSSAAPQVHAVVVVKQKRNTKCHLQPPPCVFVVFINRNKLRNKQNPERAQTPTHWLQIVESGGVLRPSARWSALPEDRARSLLPQISFCWTCAGGGMATSDRRTATITHVYRGTFMHSTQDEALQILEDALLGVDTEGKIAFIEEGQELNKLCQTFGFCASEVTQLTQQEFFMPGMVDTHIHAPQYSYAGTALDMPLLQWLDTYTFPVESRFEDLEFANSVYTQVVKRTLRNGTTTACYFATIHTDASLLLGQIANDFGQRVLVGKVCMDRNDSVKHYRETTLGSQEETNRFIAELLNRKYPLVKPVVTPRFAPSCTEALLQQLGAIAKNNHLHIQSHISENAEEVKLVKALFPESHSYTDVYHRCNLLTSKTVMAHGCHLSDAELDLFRETGASLSHCPNSNTSLCSGTLNVRNVLKHKVKLGLGTDVAGGYSASMLDAVRRTQDVSKFLTIQDPEHDTLTFEEVFRLATLGGSQALSLDDQTGNFEVGKDFDALRVNVAAPDGPIDLIQKEGPKILLERFLNLGDDRNVVEVFVAGRRVVPFSEPTAE